MRPFNGSDVYWCLCKNFLLFQEISFFTFCLCKFTSTCLINHQCIKKEFWHDTWSAPSGWFLFAFCLICNIWFSVILDVSRVRRGYLMQMGERERERIYMDTFIAKFIMKLLASHFCSRSFIFITGYQNTQNAFKNTNTRARKSHTRTRECYKMCISLREKHMNPHKPTDWLVPMWPMPRINQSPRLLTSNVTCFLF